MNKEKEIKEIIEEMRDELLLHQRPHLESIRWFLYGPRAVGRTHLSCLIAIMTALERPGHWVEVYDHTNMNSTHYGYTYVNKLIRSILDKYGLSKLFDIKFSTTRIMYIGRRVI